MFRISKATNLLLGIISTIITLFLKMVDFGLKIKTALKILSMQKVSAAWQNLVFPNDVPAFEKKN